MSWLEVTWTSPTQFVAKVWLFSRLEVSDG